MQRPLVTIVTPSFNQGRFIRQTIESVLGQDYPNIEYIIMDGGSTDETASIAAEYAGRLTFISEKDRGQSHAINKGFRMARGEVVSWLNSDDIILPGAVAHAVGAFERDPTLGAVYGEGYLIDYDGAVTSRFPATEPFNLWKLVYLSDYILQQTVYFRRSILDDVGFLDETLHWGLDWDFLIRIGKRYWIAYIPEYMGSLREYDAAKTFSGGRRRFRELAAIMRTHGHMRFPPGYVTYGLDTYQRILGRYLPFASWRNALSRTAHRMISRVLNESQGVYSDGWAAGRVKWMFPAGRGRARLQGMLPAFPQLADQSLEVTCNGSLVAHRSLAFGDFAIEFDYQGPDDRSPSTIEVKASKTLVPRDHDMGDDRRPLAYHFGKFERVGCSDGTVVSHPKAERT
jgi:glycosyltransferase involved in cell wall biosynthesis